MTWSREAIAEHVQDAGLIARRFQTCVGIQRRDAAQLSASVFFENVTDPFDAEIAFNPDDPHGVAALDALSEELPATEARGRWPWPRLGVEENPAALQRLSELIAHADPRIAHHESESEHASDATAEGAQDVSETESEIGSIPTFRGPPRSMATLEKLGRVRLSTSFFMRDFLYSEIAAVHRLSNVPDDPNTAIEAGRGLCESLIEPLHQRFGRTSIRSGYRSPEVNGFGNAHGLNCSSNEHSYGRHIWDYRDERGFLGATACVIVHAFIDYYERTGHWEALAWWIHDHLPYSRLEFYPKFAAVNLTWSEEPEGRIASRTPPRTGVLTKRGDANFEGSHEGEYREWLAELT